MPSPEPTSQSPNPPPAELAPRVSPVRRVLRRVLAGVLFILPVLLTLVVIRQVYLLLNSWLIEPVALLIIPSGIENPYWTAVEKYITPPLTLLAVFVFLYLMGYLFQTRIQCWVQWVFERIPGVSTLYKAINDVLGAMQGPQGLKKIDTVVLVPFPHDQARMVGYLMGESRDARTGEQLACVYVPIGLFPPSGYTMVLPFERVTVTDWSSTAPWKSLLSGGLTLPETLPFHTGPLPEGAPSHPDSRSHPDSPSHPGGSSSSGGSATSGNEE